MISISQGIDWYKVPVVGKNGKLNETIEGGALWSSTIIRTPGGLTAAISCHQIHRVR